MSPSSPVDLQAAYRRCEEITSREARNFSYGIRLLPADKRQAMSALYALARRIDDIGDGTAPPEDKLTALAQVRKQVASLAAPSREDDPVLIALADVARRYPIPLSAIDELIDGCELDVHGARYATIDDLVGYCRRVAGTVGRLSLGVFGCADPATAEPLADALGVALQLTNILRDIVEDRQQMGRVKVVAYAETAKDNVAMIAQFEKDMMDRNRAMKSKKLTKSTAEFPRCILWMDEVLLLPRTVYKDTAAEFSPLRRIMAAGPASMFTVLAGTQLVYSEDLGAVKGLFSQRIALRLPSPEITDTAFFKGAVAQGAQCHLLHKTRDRGVGWALNTDGELTKIRAAKVEESDLAAALRGITPDGMNVATKTTEPAKPTTQSVYFIEAAGTDLVKIGIAAVPKDRLRELQTASPHKLSILATMPGGKAAEGRLHRHFAGSRATGEWFHRTPELDALIADVQAGNSDAGGGGHARLQQVRKMPTATRDWVTRNAHSITRRDHPEPSNEELAMTPSYLPGTDFHGGHTAAVWSE